MTASVNGSERANAVARASCSDCGLRLVGVIDLADEELLWFPMPIPSTG